MRYIYILLILGCFSCNNERVLQLPEIENAKVTEVLDVSPAYIFYDETQPDSTLLNRKNLIITTNWLVNVDKRLTLRQAIPHIQFLQDKKRNAEMHKNEDAKNYFTCNDTSIGNLGFIEFTDVYFELNSLPKPNEEIITTKDTLVIQKLQDEDYYKQLHGTDAYSTLSLFVKDDKSVYYYDNKNRIVTISIDSKLKELLPIVEERHIFGLNLQFWFDNQLTFQEYISIKRKLSKIESEIIVIDTNEFIY